MERGSMSIGMLRAARNLQAGPLGGREADQPAPCVSPGGRSPVRDTLRWPAHGRALWPMGRGSLTDDDTTGQAGVVVRCRGEFDRPSVGFSVVPPQSFWSGEQRGIPPAGPVLWLSCARRKEHVSVYTLRSPKKTLGRPMGIR